MEFDDFTLPPIRSFTALIRPQTPYYFVFWLVSFGIFLFLMKRLFIRRESSRIQFYVTDMWSAIFALLPAFVLLLGATNEQHEVDLIQIGMFVVTFCSICGGIWLWLVLEMPKPEQPRASRWSHFVSVLGGGFVGLLGVVASGFAFTVFVASLPMLKQLPQDVFGFIAFFVSLYISIPWLFVFTALAIWFTKKTYDLFSR